MSIFFCTIFCFLLLIKSLALYFLFSFIMGDSTGPSISIFSIFTNLFFISLAAKKLWFLLGEEMIIAINLQKGGRWFSRLIIISSSKNFSGLFIIISFKVSLVGLSVWYIMRDSDENLPALPLNWLYNCIFYSVVLKS